MQLQVVKAPARHQHLGAAGAAAAAGTAGGAAGGVGAAGACAIDSQARP